MIGSFDSLKPLEKGAPKIAAKKNILIDFFEIELWTNRSAFVSSWVSCDKKIFVGTNRRTEAGATTHWNAQWR